MWRIISRSFRQVMFVLTVYERKGVHMRGLKEFWKEEAGIGTVEMILLLVVLIGLVIIFKKEITNLVNGIFKTINSQAGQIA